MPADGTPHCQFVPVVSANPFGSSLQDTATAA